VHPCDDRPIAGVDALELGPVTVDELAADEVTPTRLSAHASSVHVALITAYAVLSASGTGLFNSLGS
jgi:hypothetical protein